MNIEDEDKRTIWCGNLSDRVSEDLLYELFLQAAPVERVKIIKGRNPNQASFGFVTLKHLNSVLYALQLLNGVSLFSRKINMKPREGVDFVKIPPILPPIPDISKDDMFDKLIESGDRMLHFTDKPKYNPVSFEHRTSSYKENKYSGRGDRFRNDRHPYRNQRHNQNYSYYGNRY